MPETHIHVLSVHSNEGEFQKQRTPQGAGSRSDPFSLCQTRSFNLLSAGSSLLGQSMSSSEPTNAFKVCVERGKTESIVTAVL